MQSDSPQPIHSLPALLAAAPHRLLFLGGASALLLSMLWWAAWLGSARWGHWLAQPVGLPAGWAHALGLQYQALPLFIFGFLLTVFPRWMGQPPIPRWQYVPVGGSLLLGYLSFHAGLLGLPALMHFGLLCTLLGWTVGLWLLLQRLVADRSRCLHALSATLALGLGLVGLLFLLAFLHGGSARLAYAAIRIGTFGLLLPIFLTVCHRMLPFFSEIVCHGYRCYRPAWALWLLLAGCLAHLGLELMHGQAWLWLVDLPLACLCAYLGWRWRPTPGCRAGLLWVLHLGYAWLPLALLAFAMQSLWYAATDAFVGGRIPVHLLTIGFFGSLVVAMVTRVTQGHSGRPLQMGAIPWLSFGLLQGVLLWRIQAELAADPGWMAAAAAAWIAALLPWVLRSAWIYLTPRLDGRPG